jgi:ATP-dependent helicase/DNAse subunit B
LLLLDIFELYEQLKHKAGLFDKDDAFFSLPMKTGLSLVVLDSFQDYDPNETAFIEKLSSQADEVLTIRPKIFVPGQPEKPDFGASGKIAVSIDEYESPIQELEELVRKIKALINAGVSPESITVVLPDLKKFADILWVLFKESGIEANISTGVPLSRTPAGELLMNVVSLSYDTSTSERFFEILRSPLFISLSFESVKKAEKAIFRKVAVSRWERYVSSLEELLDSDERNLPEEFRFLLKSLLNTLKAMRDPGSNLEMYEALCDFSSDLYKTFKNDFYEVREIYERLLVFRYSAAFRQFLEKTKDVILFKTVISKILDMSTKSYRGDVSQGVQITGVLETRGQNADFIFMVGFTDDAFPSLSEKNFLIPDGIKEFLNLPTSMDYFRKQKEDFYRLISSARYGVFISSSKTEGRDVKEASRFSSEFKSFLDTEKPESVIRIDWKELRSRPGSLIQIDLVGYQDRDYEEEWEKVKRLEKEILNPVVNITTVIKLLDCDYKFYLTHENLTADEYPKHLPESKTMGNLLHSVLKNLLSSEKFFEEAVKVFRYSREKFLELAKEMVLNEIEKNTEINESLSRKSVERLSFNLAQTIEFFIEKKAEGNRVVLELPKEREFKGVLFKGRIDAVVLSPAEEVLELYDFKFIRGKNVKFKRNGNLSLDSEEEKKYAVQLALYEFLLYLDVNKNQFVNAANFFISEGIDRPVLYHHNLGSIFEEALSLLERAAMIAKKEILPADFNFDPKKCYVCFAGEVCPEKESG